jgi:lipopolysaccharide heptosyltransferase II
MRNRTPPFSECVERLAAADPRRIAIIKPSALGDVVQSMPLLGPLRQRFPSARIAWVIAEELRGLLESHPQIDELLIFRRRGGWRDGLRLLGELRRGRFDLVLDLQGLARTGLMTLATRAPLRVGLQTAREGADRACHLTLPHTGPDVPAHARYWRVAECLGLGASDRQTVLPISDDDRCWAEAALSALFRGGRRTRRPVIAVHPGAKWITKRWPADRFAAVAARAAREFGAATVLVGSPGEKPLSERVVAMLKSLVPSARALDLTGQTTLGQLAAVLQSADLALTNDSGPMHLAAALGTPVVAVFTCTSPRRSGPPGDKHALVSTNVFCAASYKKRCPHRGLRHMACLDEIGVDRVWQALRTSAARLLQEPAAA